jgi:catalase (peroxidase I)
VASSGQGAGSPHGVLTQVFVAARTTVMNLDRFDL